MVRPSSASERIRSRTHRTPSGSRPFTGSSKISTSGSPSSAPAMPSRWLMPSRETAAAAAGHVPEAGGGQHLVDPSPRDAVGARLGQQVPIGGATGMHTACVEQRTHLAQRLVQRDVRLAEDQRRPKGGPVQTEDAPDGRRLAGPVRAQEARDPCGSDLHRQIADGGLVAVAFRQST